MTKLVPNSYRGREKEKQEQENLWIKIKIVQYIKERGKK